MGKNPAQPTVRSFLPLQVLVPFLRGGGRAITLEGLTQAERSLLYSVRSFAKFRQEFVVTTLTGGTIQTFGTNVTTGGFTTGGNIDPTIGFLNVVEDVQIVENQVKNLAVFEQFVEVYQELINGESSGLSQLQLDQVRQQVQSARTQLINSRTDLSERPRPVQDPARDAPRRARWSSTGAGRPASARSSRRSTTGRSTPSVNSSELDEHRRPAPQARGPGHRRPVLPGDLHAGGRPEPGRPAADRRADRAGNRLDLMNARAQLYDTWRQIRVSANALKGILNVAVTNQFVTPPTTNNPFGFVDQAKQFSLVINAELPLVRVAERNNFRQPVDQLPAAAADAPEHRGLHQVPAPPGNPRDAGALPAVPDRPAEPGPERPAEGPGVRDDRGPAARPTAATQAAVQTTNLIQFQNTVVNNENSLVTTWYNYQLSGSKSTAISASCPLTNGRPSMKFSLQTGPAGGYAAAVGPDGRPAVARPAAPSPGVGRN